MSSQHLHALDPLKWYLYVLLQYYAVTLTHVIKSHSSLDRVTQIKLELESVLLSEVFSAVVRVG